VDDRAAWELRRVEAWKRTQLALIEAMKAEKEMREVHVLFQKEWVDKHVRGLETPCRCKRCHTPLPLAETL